MLYYQVLKGCVDMKTTTKDFKVFMDECERLVVLLGLRSYEVRYIHMKLDNARATASIDYNAGLAQVKFGLDWDDKAGSPICVDAIKSAARHEIAHVLIGRLHCIAGSRFVSENEITEAVEEIANRLEGVLG